MAELMLDIVDSSTKLFVEAMRKLDIGQESAADLSQTRVDAELRESLAAAAIIASAEESLLEEFLIVLANGVEGGTARLLLRRLHERSQKMHDSLITLRDGVIALGFECDPADFLPVLAREQRLIEKTAALLARIRPELPQGFLDRANAARAEAGAELVDFDEIYGRLADGGAQ